MEARHLDGDSINNHLDNLEWGTRSENTKDAIKHGTNKTIFIKGEKHPNANLSDAEVGVIKQMVNEGILQKEVAKVYGVNPSTISRIVRDRRRS